MKYSRVLVSACLIVPLVVTFGCGGSTKTSISKKKPETTRTKKLPKLGSLRGPLDNGRLKTAAPKGWFVPSRSSKWIIRFKESRQTKYPTIIITGEDYGQISNVSKKNVKEFAEQIAEVFEENSDMAKLAKPVTPIEVGRRWGITYGRRAKVKKVIVDRLFFETVVAGRKYTFELRALKGGVSKYKPYLLAVVGGTTFLKKTDSAELSTDTPAEEQPAEESKEDPFS